VTLFLSFAEKRVLRVKMTIHGMFKRIVRNDAIRVDPPEIYNWRVIALTASACFAGALFGVDAGIIGGVLAMPDFQRFVA
jgi:hypothetical protein